MEGYPKGRAIGNQRMEVDEADQVARAGRSRRLRAAGRPPWFVLEAALRGRLDCRLRAYPARDVCAGRSWTERGGHETVPS